MKSQSALIDIAKLRQRARHHARRRGHSGYGADRKMVLKLLNDSLATEIVCVLRYRRHHFMAREFTRRRSPGISGALERRAAHADQLAERIVQLGGAPDFCAGHAYRTQSRRIRGGRDLSDMIKENLVAERIAIDSYRAFIAYLAIRIQRPPAAGIHPGRRRGTCG